MKYTAVLKNGEKVRRLTIEAENMHEANKIIREFVFDKSIRITVHPVIEDEYGNPIPDGIISGAWEVCKVALKCLVNREGGSEQWQLLNDVIYRKTDGLAADCHQEACLALLEGIKKNIPIEQQFDEAYAAVNRWLYNQNLRDWRYKNAKELIQIDGLNEQAAIIEVSPGMFSIIKTNSNYIPIDQDVIVVRSMQYIAVILQTLNDITEKQMQIVYNVVSRDMSISAAGHEDNIGRAAAHRRVIRIRDTAMANKRLYAQHRIGRRELQQLFNSLSPLARKVALDVFQRRAY